MITFNSHVYNTLTSVMDAMISGKCKGSSIKVDADSRGKMARISGVKFQQERSER
jgi:hypothetical protein